MHYLPDRVGSLRTGAGDDRSRSPSGRSRRRAAGQRPAAVGDVVPPRQRGVARSLAGPLIGGFFTSHGACAGFILTSRCLVCSPWRCQASASASSGVDGAPGSGSARRLPRLPVLLTTLGGTTYAWDSLHHRVGRPGGGGPRGFRLRPQRAPEPGAAARALCIRALVVTTWASSSGSPCSARSPTCPSSSRLLCGQLTASGLQLVRRRRAAARSLRPAHLATGRYKVFPGIGLRSAPSGCSSVQASIRDRLARGRLVHARARPGPRFRDAGADPRVENSVPYAQLGIATSSATPFRSIGGSLGDRDPRRSSLTGSRTASLPAAGRIGRRLEPDPPPDQSGSGLSTASRPSRRLRALVHGFPLNRVRHRGRSRCRRIPACLDPGGASAAQDHRGSRRW